MYLYFKSFAVYLIKNLDVVQEPTVTYIPCFLKGPFHKLYVWHVVFQMRIPLCPLDS